MSKNPRENNPIYQLSQKAGISLVTVYKRIKEIQEKEGITRLPTLAELKVRNAGRPRKYNY